MKPTGVKMIALERKRQIEEEGYRPEDDALLVDGDLACAGAAYAVYDYKISASYAELWPFSIHLFKPKDKLRNLVRAGALIAAEIDRLQRQG